MLLYLHVSSEVGLRSMGPLRADLTRPLRIFALHSLSYAYWLSLSLPLPPLPLLRFLGVSQLNCATDLLSGNRPNHRGQSHRAASNALLSRMQVNRLLAVALGVALHTVACNFEIDMHAIALAGLFSVLEMVYFYITIKTPGATLYDAIFTVYTQTACLTIGFVASMLLYRGLFHRLRRFPGPAAARLTKFYAVWKSSLARQYHLELGAMQAKYGDVVRTGPRELTIFRGEAIAPLAACRKSTLYQIEDWDNDRLGLIETRDIEDHRRRRRPWDTALSTKSLAKYDEAMQRTVGHCLDGLASPETEEKAIDITRWVSLFAWDVMGNVGFGKDFGQVSSGGSEHWAVKAMKDQAKFVAYVKPVPWVMNAASNIPYADGAVRPFRDYCSSLVDEKISTERDDKEIPSNIVSWILREYRKKTPYAPKTRNALNSDARTIATAGA